MSFTEAIRSVLTQYVGFSGRARRSEFWYWALFQLVIGVIALMLDRAVFNAVYGSWFSIIVSLGLLLPSLAVAVRRLHDTSHRGWWIFIVILPLIGSIILLIFYVQDSHPDNKYGPSPKAVTSAPIQPEPGPGPAPA
jgi:uncharacterized membrane protein YhaH (DUF805 family)